MGENVWRDSRGAQRTGQGAVSRLKVVQERHQLPAGREVVAGNKIVFRGLATDPPSTGPDFTHFDGVDVDGLVPPVQHHHAHLLGLPAAPGRGLAAGAAAAAAVSHGPLLRLRQHS